MRTTNPGSSGVRGPRKRTLSAKAAATGGDTAERQRRRLEEIQKKGAKTTLTKKTTTRKVASVAKTAPQNAPVDVEDTSDGSDMYDLQEPEPETIVIDDDKDGDKEDGDEPEENAEDELGMLLFCYLFAC